MRHLLAVLLLSAAPALAQQPMPMPTAQSLPQATAVAEAQPIKIEKAERSGYAILALTPTTDKPITQVEWVVFSTSAEITYDEAGPILVVTVPANGQTVYVYANALVDGKMTKHVSTTVQGKATT